MARSIEEQVRQIQNTVRDPDLQRAAISELHRREALRAINGKTVATVTGPTRDWHDALLQTSAGKVAIQAKLDKELKAQANSDALVQARLDIADRIRQLKELVHEVFVLHPKIAEPVNGWKPRVRFDIYQRSKETCRKLGQAGGEEYNRVLTTVKYAMTGSKAYRDAIETLGL